MARTGFLRSATAIGAVAVVTLALVAVAAKWPGRKSVVGIGGFRNPGLEMSYEIAVTAHCADCLSYAVKTRDKVVTFSCRNCAVHEASFVVDATAIASLSEAFLDSRFFSMPRLNEGYPQQFDHVSSQTWSYRDERQTHEVKTLRAPLNADLQRLRDRMLSIGRVDYFTKTPPFELIQELLKGGHWNPSSEGLAYLAGTHEYQAVQFLLDYKGGYLGGRRITDEVLEQAARGADVQMMQLIVSYLPEPQRAAAASRMLEILTRYPRPEYAAAVKWLTDAPK